MAPWIRTPSSGRAGHATRLGCCWARRSRGCRSGTDFAEIYADQNERDYASFQAAVKDGTVESATEI